MFPASPEECWPVANVKNFEPAEARARLGLQDLPPDGRISLLEFFEYGNNCGGLSDLDQARLFFVAGALLFP